LRAILRAVRAILRANLYDIKGELGLPDSSTEMTVGRSRIGI